MGINPAAGRIDDRSGYRSSRRAIGAGALQQFGEPARERAEISIVYLRPTLRPHAASVIRSARTNGSRRPSTWVNRLSEPLRAHRTFSRNSRVRWCSAALKILSGVPSSTTTPPSMNTIRFATSRANPISWVTISKVMPSSASSRIVSRDLFHRFWIERCRHFVKQHDFGFEARLRAIATRCCCPPTIRPGERVPFPRGGPCAGICERSRRPPRVDDAGLR